MDIIKTPQEFDKTLRDYQKVAVNNIDNKYNSDIHNRYAAAIMPTGGGKSFIAIREIISFKDKKVLYFAPTNAITSQVKNHLFTQLIYPKMKEENPLVKEEKDYEFSEIDKLVEEYFPNLTFICYAKDNLELSNEKESQVMEDATVFQNSNIGLIIADEAHRIGASSWEKTFQKLIDDHKEAKVIAITATPERHDEQGKDMIDEIARYVYPNETVLRNEYIAQEIYLPDAIKDGIVICPEIISVDASLAKSSQYTMMVDYLNKAKKEFEKAKNDLNNAQTNLKKAEKEFQEADEKNRIYSTSESRKIFVAKEKAKDLALQNIDKFKTILDAKKQNCETLEDSLKIMEEVIGFNPIEIGKKEIEEKIDKATSKVFQEQLNNKNGKYIAFIPKRDVGEKNPQKYYEKWIERIKKQFEGVKDENGNDVNVTFYVVSGNSEVKINDDGMLDKNGTYPKNMIASQIHRFENTPNNSGGIKILLTVDAINEGVHVDGIDGEIMYRSIKESENIYLQQLGRTVSSINRNLPMDMQPHRQVIDVAGNTFNQIEQGLSFGQSYFYDLQRINDIIKWKEDHNGEFPNINRTIQNGDDKEKIQVEEEIRNAKYLKVLYGRYFGKTVQSVEGTRDYEIKKDIIMLCNEKKLWDNYNYPDRVNEEETKDGFLEYTDSQQRFIRAFYNGIKLVTNIPNRQRVKKLLNILSIINRHKDQVKDIEKFALPKEILMEFSNGKGICSTNNDYHISLSEFLSTHFDSQVVENILHELGDFNLIKAINKRETISRRRRIIL